MKSSGVLSVLVGLTAALSACAKSPDKISAAYISPLQYQNYNCDQIRSEYERISFRVMEVSGKQKDASTRDAVATGVGIVLFWPALFFLASGDHEEELARLKGEYEALERAAIEKNCDIADEMQAAQEARIKREAEERAERKRIAENSEQKPRFN